MMAQEQASVVAVLSTLAELDAIELGVGAALTKMEQQAQIAFGSQAPTILSARRIFGTRPPALADSAWVLEPNHTIRREPIPSGKPTLMLFLYDCAGSDRSWCMRESGGCINSMAIR